MRFKSFMLNLSDKNDLADESHLNSWIEEIIYDCVINRSEIEIEFIFIFIILLKYMSF